MTALPASADNFSKLKTQAEKEYAEGSYQRALALYQQARDWDLPKADKEWVRFRLADALWRSQAASKQSDSTQLEQAREELEALLQSKPDEEDRDQLWAEIQESLGDYYWDRQGYQDWGDAWSHYQQALDWWAGARDIELARKRYLALVWRCALPSQPEPYYYYGYYGNYLPLEIVENVLKISQTKQDQAHAHYLLAMTYQYQGGDWEQMERIPEEFEAALATGKTSEWYDDALFKYAEWLSNYGRRRRLPNGQWEQKPDLTKALELYRRLLKEFKKGETRYYEEARQRIESITESTLSVSVSNIFLPGSEIQAYLNWRNQKRIDLAIYALDLTQDVAFSKKQENGDWLQAVKVSGLKKVKAWSKTVEQGEYQPGSETLRLDSKLPAGAYLIEAKGNKASSRDFILVTDATLVVKTSGRRVLAYFCQAEDGSPVPNARVKLWLRGYENGKNTWNDQQKQTDADGLAIFELKPGSGNELFIAASAGAQAEQQAFALSYAYYESEAPEDWRIYAFTDRSAYRPGDQVQWKMIARTYQNGGYTTPANLQVEYEVTDPRGAKVKAGQMKLNLFGSGWGTVDLTEAMPLGEYQIQFYSQGRKRSLGGATLFRLEEYKLPEFKVSIQTPEEQGRKKAFRLGETVEAVIQADYYFGGPVGNASVEVVVYQNPYYHWWQPDYEFPWFYADMQPQRGYWGDGQVVKREMLKTDAQGRASVFFATPRGGSQDFEYRIEARVTDSSRREIIGSESVRVTRHRYEVYLRPEHSLYRPQDKIRILVKALDANQNPVAVAGQVRVTRDRWVELWLNPSGKTVAADAWRKEHPRGPAAPWTGDKPELGWQVKFQGYEHEDVLTTKLKTDDQGEAELSWVAGREGYYRVAWESEDAIPRGLPLGLRMSSPKSDSSDGLQPQSSGWMAKGDSRSGEPVTAETTVWAASNATTELGYRHGGLEIVIDKDTVRAGEKAPVLLTAPSSGRCVLFSVEADDLYSYQVVRMQGAAKLLEVPIEPSYVPNVFLSATMVNDLQLFQDTKQVVVPPVEHFLNLEVKPDREQYQPRTEGTLTLTTRDHQGKPVSAEVALALVDEAVSYIQADYTGDLRQFYFGSKRGHSVQTEGTLNQRSYVRLAPPPPPAEMPVGGMERDEAEEVSASMDDRAMGAGMRAKSAPAPSAQAPKRRMAAKESKQERASVAKPQVTTEGAPEPEEAGQPSVVVRQDFRATAFWQPDVQTGPDGQAVVKVKYPDSLTTWKAVGRAVSAGSQFGQASASTRTKMPLIVRLQAPRFFLTSDKVVVSAVVNNNTDQALAVTVSLKALGLDVAKDAPVKLKVAANSEARADWTAAVKNPGEAKLTVEARGGAFADAMEKTYPVYEHGIEKFVAKAGRVRGRESLVKLDLPKERKDESTSLTIQVAPSLAVALLDALPYLFDYPYGCTEQTLSRFLPAVIVAKTLQDLHVKPQTIADKMFGGVEKATADKTHSAGAKDFKLLDKMVKQGLERLYDFQHSDGGWGWWKEGSSDVYMTAYVLWGLCLASEAGVDIRSAVLDRADTFLNQRLVEYENQPDLQAWMLHAQARLFALWKRPKLHAYQTKAFDRVWSQRDKLNAYTRSLLALAARDFGLQDKAQILIRNLENGVIKDDKPDTTVLHAGGGQGETLMPTAHWGEEGFYWRWSEGGIEATAFALRALMAVDPKNALVEPVMNWLVKNRRGAQWSNTRDTAIAVLALTDYLRVSRELKQDLEFEVLVNGRPVVSKKLSAEESLGAPSVFAVKREFLKDGANEILFRNKTGQGAIYFSAQASFFSLEEPITPVGNEIFARRQYFKFVGRPTLLKGYVYDKVPLADNETVESGQRIETVVTVEAKNNYEYLVFEDLKPAGVEAVEVKSGQPLYAQEIKSGAQERVFKGKPGKKPRLAADAGDTTGRTAWVYQELRDRKVALFIDHLPQGVWEMRYTLRAETPGTYHALPVVGHAMYVPELRCNGAEVRIKVEESSAGK
ncbi:MAG: alpha-2-macroglobulin family protein [candidate division FCPU426 bacterium]